MACYEDKYPCNPRLTLFIEDRNLCIYGAPLLETMYAGYFTYGIVMILITYLQIRGKALKALAVTKPKKCMDFSYKW